MQKYIWLVPLLPLIGAAINGLLGRKLRFSEQIIGGIAVGSVALAFSSRTVVMDGGVVVESGPPREVLSNPQHERTTAFLSKVL